MDPYRDTPYWVHNMPYDSKYGRTGFKKTYGGQWRNMPGQPARFYMHRGPYSAARPFVPLARYHSNPRMNNLIRLKHRNAWAKREWIRSSAAGNYRMQKNRQKAGFDPISNISRNFPRDFLPFLDKELKERDKIFAQMSREEAREAATESAEKDDDTSAPQQAAREREMEDDEGPQRKRARDA